MAEAIGAVLERERERGALRPGCDPARPPAHADTGPLQFPTRVVAEDDRLWVSDAGHGRVCELARDASDAWRVVRTWDGFAEPQGLARLGGETYVADRRGHAVFRLAAEGPVRVAGTGRIGDWRLAPGPAAEIDLRSPWGLAALPDGDLAVAMAGAHQLWRLAGDHRDGFAAADLALLAGAGGEELMDGPADQSLLAQPTGVALAGRSLAIADSESSAVRILDLEANEVRTVVGTGLFDFGDRDGEGDDVLLQHAQDLAWRGEHLVVADTYNDRLKLVEPESRRAVAHPGEAGTAGAFWEPMGVSAYGEQVLVADTNNHRIVSVAPDGAMSPLQIEE
jgi:hypothetical protein